MSKVSIEMSQMEKKAQPSGCGLSKALSDVPVLLVFFIRAECLKKVFERIREVRPKELFLYQDGPRPDHPEDLSKIQACREVVSHIDWECNVHHLYQEENRGADLSGYLASSWAFAQVEYCLVLEDDVLPSLSFFRFCSDVLKRYAHDERVSLVSSQNMEGQTQDVDSDYFFSHATFTWGWASWARVVRRWDAELSFLSDKEQLGAIAAYLDQCGIPSGKLKRYHSEAIQGKKRWESILIGNQYFRRGLTIVPKCNMSQNIGLNMDSAHYSADISLMAKGDRLLFEMPAYDLDTDSLCHPESVVPHKPYLKRAYRLRAFNHPAVRMFRVLESMWYMICAGRIKEAFSLILGRIKRICHYRTCH